MKLKALESIEIEWSKGKMQKKMQLHIFPCKASVVYRFIPHFGCAVL